MDLQTSIFQDIKSDIVGSIDDEIFDNQIIAAINSVFVIMYQNGIGPEDKPFYIENGNETWSDFFNGNTHTEKLGAVKTYMSRRVQMIFDPSSNSNMSTAIENVTKELEWRLNIESENLI